MTEQIILDTDMYLSYYTKRDQKEFEIAKNYLQNLKDGVVSIFLPNIIIAEIIYVLVDHYNYTKSEVIIFVMSILYNELLINENKVVILLALQKFEILNFDFAYCYLLAVDELNEYKLQTFDKKLKNQVGK
jgi:predicted nucleic-acid-binding protein